ncbi:MAG TPA: hypothetical protein VFL92_08340 [Sphingomonas sp.]|nr:hypothetical protein [Sphingomonas sp.]
MTVRGRMIVVGAAVLTGAGLMAGALQAQRSTPPKARYEMDVGTTSGFAGMAAMRANPMAMMFGGGRGGSAQHSLDLRLGSSLAPGGGAPHADHFMPAGANLGDSVPLVTPVNAPAGPSEPGMPLDFRRPKGRMLIFWGCGAHAGPGQPVVIDFSKLAAGQMPPHLFSADVPVETGPTASNSRTFGEWPNDRSHKALRPDASLIGAHRIAGNYSPEIDFTLDQDFMPALDAASEAAPDGSTPIRWNAVQGATGYYASLVGAQGQGGEDEDMVMWTSAGRQEFGGGLSGYLSPATVRRLIAEHVVMPPSQTSCTVPAEVKKAAGQFMMATLTAFGPERDFAHPPRPADPKAVWRPDWTTRVRYRSAISLMLGMPAMEGMGMAGMSGGDDEGARRPEQQEPKHKCKGLGGFLKSRIGGC